MSTIRYINFFIATVMAAIILVECANPVTPAGGPRDETPPGFLKADPPILTKNFTASKVRIYFDEFVEFKELNQQVIISPPMNQKPEFKIKGKSVVIEFKEELKDSTTYNIFFGNAIVDLTENNPISNFQYVFSTGDVLDSLTFKGNVLDAFTLEPVKDLNVMLYLNNNDTLPLDSLPYYVRPWYYSKTSESGDFQFNNISDKEFKIFVLEDANANMLFDMKSERIAFIDSLIHPYYLPPPVLPDTSSVSDSLLMDTSAVSDSLHMDSTVVFWEPEPLVLAIFQERDSVQRFIKASLVKSGKLMFVFKAPTLSPEIKALNMDESINWKITEINRTRDTINFWIKEEVPDTMTFIVSDNTEILDTVDIATVVKTKKRRGKNKEIKPEKLVVKFGKKTELNTPQKLKFNYPIKHFDLSQTMLIENEDTLIPEFHFSDSLGLSGEFTHQWLENGSYSFMIPDSAFFGLGGQSHDTLRHNLKIKALADYGNLYVNTFLVEAGINHIIQLMKEDVIVSQYIITEDSRVAFEYLHPGNYRIKVIIDLNNNNTWDTGHYILGIQPEPVFFFHKEITIRANWDIEEDWEI